MSLPARSSVWSASSLPGHRRVRDLLHADCDVHSVSPLVAGAPDAAGHAALDDLILAAIGDRQGETWVPSRPSLVPDALDVLVVRGGPGRGRGRRSRPAGSASTSLVVDKAGFPRDKTCGDGLTTGALRLLDAPRRRRPHASRRTRRSPRPCSCRRPAARSSCRFPPTARTRASCRASSSTPRSSTTPRARGVEVREHAARRPRVEDDDAGHRRRSPTARRARARWRGRGRRPLLAGAAAARRASRRSRRPGPARRTSWHAFRQYFTGVDDRRLWVLFEEDFLPGYAWVFPVGGRPRQRRLRRARADRHDGCAERARRSPRSGATLADRPQPAPRARARRASPRARRRAWPIPADVRPARGSPTAACCSSATPPTSSTR